MELSIHNDSNEKKAIKDKIDMKYQPKTPAITNNLNNNFLGKNIPSMSPIKKEELKVNYGSVFAFIKIVAAFFHED